MTPEFTALGTRDTERWRQRVESLIERKVIQGPLDPKYVPHAVSVPRVVDRRDLGVRGRSDLLALATQTK